MALIAEFGKSEIDKDVLPAFPVNLAELSAEGANAAVEAEEYVNTIERATVLEYADRVALKSLMLRIFILSNDISKAVKELPDGDESKTNAQSWLGFLEDLNKRIAKLLGKGDVEIGIRKTISRLVSRVAAGLSEFELSDIKSVPESSQYFTEDHLEALTEIVYDLWVRKTKGKSIEKPEHIALLTELRRKLSKHRNFFIGKAEFKNISDGLNWDIEALGFILE